MNPFWAETFGALPGPETEWIPIAGPQPQGPAFDVRFSGFGGSRLAGQLFLPAGRGGRVPGMLQFHGYMSCKNEPALQLPWLEMGMAVLAVDARGQAGQSGDMSYPGENTGKITQGISEAKGSYLQALYADTVQALNVLLSRPEVDPARILAEGQSQGGGLALALACLDKRVALAAADNPSLMGFGMKLDGGVLGSAEEIRAYLRRFPEQAARVMRTLEVFDLHQLLGELHCPSLWSLSDDDPICPPPTVQEGYGRVKAPKEQHIYHKKGHEVDPGHLAVKTAWVARHFSISS